LGRGGELVLDWENIRKVGRDVVLVDDSELAGADGYTPG